MFTENEENDLPMPNTEWSFSNRNQSLRDSEHQSEPLDQTLQHFEMPVDPPESHVINSNMPIKFSVDSISVHNSNNRNKPNPKMDVVGNSDPMIRPDSMKKKELPQRLVSNSSPTSVVQSATIIPHLETSNFELYRVHIISDIKWLSKFLSLSQSVCENIYERIKESKLNNNLLIDAVVSLLDKPLLNCGNYLKRLDWDEKSKSDNDINDQKHHLVNKKKEALNLRTQIQNYLNENNKKKSLYQSSFIQCPGTTKRLIKLISAKEEELNQNDDKQKRRDINLIFNLVIMAFYDLEHRKEIEMSREIHLHMADKIYRLYRDTTYINDRAIKIIEEILYLSAKTN